MDLMGAQEVAELLGISRQRVHQLAERADFPAPVAVLAAGKIWLGEDVRRWAATHRRPLDE
jgi:prophage regulatory protein